MPFRRKTADSSDSALPQTPVNPADLDDELVQSVRDTVKRLLNAKDATVPEESDKAEAQKALRKTEAQKRLGQIFKLPPAWHVAGQTAGWVLWLSVLWLFVAFIISLGTEGGWSRMLPPLPALTFGWAGAFAVGKIHDKWKEKQTWLPQTLARVLPALPPNTPMETAYCDALAALFEQQIKWGTGATQNVLHDLKTLLHTGRQTTARRAEIEQAMNHQSVRDMEDEAARLAARVEAATDASARETLKQSLVLLEARLARAKSLEPLRQQLEAQEEVIGQALAEAQSALSGANLAHWTLAAVTASSARAAQTASGTLMETAPLAYLGDTVSRLHRQTESVEQAVREVVQVGGAQKRE